MSGSTDVGRSRAKSAESFASEKSAATSARRFARSKRSLSERSKRARAAGSGKAPVDEPAPHAGFEPARRDVVLIERRGRRVEAGAPAAPARFDERVELGLLRQRDIVERVAIQALEAEERVGQVGVAEEDEDRARLHARGDEMVLEREVPPGGAGGRVIEERHEFIACRGDLAELDGVDPRAHHRVADEDPCGPAVAEVLDGDRVECAVRAAQLERRQVAEPRRIPDDRVVHGAQAERGSERRRHDEGKRPRRVPGTRGLTVIYGRRM
jgi:hypothetical protein